MDTLPTSRFRALLAELSAEPTTHFDTLSPRGLWTFLRGYVLAVPSFRPILARVDDRVARDQRTRLTLSAGTLQYLALGDSAPGYRALLQRVSAALPATESVDEAEAPMVRSFRQLLPTLLQRPTLLLGSNEAVELSLFLRGLHRGLVDRGVDPAHDRALLGMYEHALQQRYGISAPWERILTVWDVGRGESAAEFARSFMAWDEGRVQGEARP